MIIFVVELFETMEKHSKLKKFARFYIVIHCYTLLLQNLLFNRLQSHFLLPKTQLAMFV